MHTQAARRSDSESEKAAQPAEQRLDAFLAARERPGWFFEWRVLAQRTHRGEAQVNS